MLPSSAASPVLTTSVLATAAAFMLVSCAGADPTRVAELEAEIAAEGAESTADDGSDDAEPDDGQREHHELRFDPEDTMSCAPRHETVVPGSWQTSAPRVEVNEEAEESVELRLRNQNGTEEGEITVQAEVLLPHDEEPDEWLSTGTTISGSEWAEVTFPADFAEAPEELEPGVYTVVWSIDGAGDRTFLACDGFKVTPRD